jgi:hypothetical protein
MPTPPLETQVILKVAEDYRQRGYEVRIQPKGSDVPDFLSEFEPDLIAHKEGESVVVEVKLGTRTSVSDRLRDIAERIKHHPGWRFSFVFVNPDKPDEFNEEKAPPLSMLQERFSNARTVLHAGQREAAFLLFWSTLEGILRLISEQSNMPITSLPSSTLIRELYSAGEISREQFEFLMHLLPIRNKLVHGFGEHEALDVEALMVFVQALFVDAMSG